MSWSEQSLHAWLLQREAPPCLQGSRGHDAAVLSELGGRPVVCVDQTIEGVHFERGTPAPRVGRKAAGRALSDLAATAARPSALLLGLSAPLAAEEAWIRAAIEAVDREARRFGAGLVGGDLACVEAPLALSVSALGSLAGHRRPPGRDRAQVGDALLISGPVGGSLLGRHLEIEPRVELGQWFFEHGACVLMDVSDGLARDLDRIARASSVRIDLEAIPLHADAQRAAARSGRTPLEHGLNDGEDHELLITLPRSAWEGLAVEAQARFPGLQAIGQIRAGSGLWIADPAGTLARRWEGRGGWLHGV